MRRYGKADTNALIERGDGVVQVREAEQEQEPLCERREVLIGNLFDSFGPKHEATNGRFDILVGCLSTRKDIKCWQPYEPEQNWTMLTKVNGNEFVLAVHLGDTVNWDIFRERSLPVWYVSAVRKPHDSLVNTYEGFWYLDNYDVSWVARDGRALRLNPMKAPMMAKERDGITLVGLR